ncbi:MAG: restriction endonuclease subunit S [Acinetobacter sp.]
MSEQKIPQGYKQTEVGVIPEDWECKTIKDITLDMLQGVNTAIDIPEYVSDGIPMLKANNVIDQILSLESVDFVSEKTYLKYAERYQIKKGDFLFSNIGARLGTGSIFKYQFSCTFAWNVMKIVPNNKKVTPEFLAYMINFPSQSEKIKSEQSGSGMGFIPKSVMQNVIIPIPKNIKEQSLIAITLSHVDDLISELEKLIAKKQAIKTATMQQLLTGKTRLPQFSLREDGTKKGYKQSELGKIPEDWEIDKIGNVVSITTGDKNTQDKVTDGLYPFFVRSQQVEKINSFSFDGEAVLTAGDGVGTGKIFHYINGKFDFHQRVYLMHNFFEKLDGYYFYIFFSNHFYERIMSMTAKSSVDSVRREMIADMPIILPTKQEQTAIAKILSDMDSEIQALEKRLVKTRQIKQGMMQELLTGKTRLLQGTVNT